MSDGVIAAADERCMKVKKTDDEDDDANLPIFTFLAIKCDLF
jgi:hypothetical protein